MTAVFMDSPAFTLFHVAISLIAIVAGVAVMYGFLAAKRLDGITLIFLLTTVATSVTGFFFHRDHVLPSHVVGVISLALLAAAIVALYGFHLRGFWRVVFIGGVVASFYLNVFVLIIQGFLKVPSLHALAPTQTEAPFLVIQGLALIVFAAVGVLSLLRFRPAVTA
jgi:hypothetical protein